MEFGQRAPPPSLWAAGGGLPTFSGYRGAEFFSALAENPLELPLVLFTRLIVRPPQAIPAKFWLCRRQKASKYGV